MGSPYGSDPVGGSGGHPETKRCPHCQRHKALGEFGKNKNTKSGLQQYCIECNRTVCAAHYQRIKQKRIARIIRLPASSIVRRPETKWCPGCQNDKPLSEFSRNKNTKSGRQTYCRVCDPVGVVLTAEDGTPLALELLADTLAVFIRENHHPAWCALQRIPGSARRERLNQIAALVVQVAVTQLGNAQPPMGGISTVGAR